MDELLIIRSVCKRWRLFNLSAVSQESYYNLISSKSDINKEKEKINIVTTFEYEKYLRDYIELKLYGKKLYFMNKNYSAQSESTSRFLFESYLSNFSQTISKVLSPFYSSFLSSFLLSPSSSFLSPSSSSYFPHSPLTIIPPSSFHFLSPLYHSHEFHNSLSSSFVTPTSDHEFSNSKQFSSYSLYYSLINRYCLFKNSSGYIRLLFLFFII
jgi:hypothetical protein